MIGQDSIQRICVCNKYAQIIAHPFRGGGLFSTKSSVLITLIVVILMLTACSEDPAKKPKKKPRAHLVEISVAQRMSLGVSHTRTGTLRALREVKIFNQEEGQIILLPYFEGDRVKTGDTIARLDDQLLQAQLTRARAMRKKAEQDLKRINDLHKRKLVSAEELIQAETELQVTKADEEVLVTRLGYTTITSPIDGVITERLTELSNLAERYTHLTTISDPASLITEVNVSELILPHISLNDETHVSIDALGANVFKGKVTRIYPSLDPITRQGTVEVTLNPVPKGVRPGQLCRVRLDTQISERLIIPFRALRQDSSGEYVFIVDQNNQTKRVTVISGQRLDEFAEVVQGIQEGDQIVIKGFLGLSDNKMVKIVSETASISSRGDVKPDD